MAHDKVIDSAKLDADLTTVADAIRERAGTTETLAFPDGFVSAVEGIQDYGGQILDGTIVEYSAPITYMRDSGLRQCSKLVKVNFPNLDNTGQYTFQHCPSLEKVNMPMVTKVESHAFATCSKLKYLDFHKVATITDNTFNYSGLVTLIIRRTEGICTLGNLNSFSNTPIARGTGYIYVPRSLVDSYKTATNWSNYADQFRALEDYTVDGTTTGEFDYVAAGYTKITLDGTQTISIPVYSTNPSGVGGCTHFEYVLPTSTDKDDIIAPTFLRRADDISSASYIGVSDIYDVKQFSGNFYLIVSMDSTLLGTTVDSIKEYLATNNLVFYVKA